jgi:hypothetical protein
MLLENTGVPDMIHVSDAYRQHMNVHHNKQGVYTFSPRDGVEPAVPNLEEPT